MSPPAKNKSKDFSERICPHLKRNEYNLCLASIGGLVVPSISELREFCLSGTFENCPVIKENQS